MIRRSRYVAPPLINLTFGIHVILAIACKQCPRLLLSRLTDLSSMTSGKACSITPISVHESWWRSGNPRIPIRKPVFKPPMKYIGYAMSISCTEKKLLRLIPSVKRTGWFECCGSELWSEGFPFKQGHRRLLPERSSPMNGTSEFWNHSSYK